MTLHLQPTDYDNDSLLPDSWSQRSAVASLHAIAQQRNMRSPMPEDSIGIGLLTDDRACFNEEREHLAAN